MSVRVEAVFARSDVWLQTAELHSKHGIILKCSLTCSDGVDESVKERLALLVFKLEGQRYGYVDDTVASLVDGNLQVGGVWEWLRTEMDS